MFLKLERGGDGRGVVLTQISIGSDGATYISIFQYGIVAATVAALWLLKL